MMFNGFASHIHAAGQARAMSRLAKAKDEEYRGEILKLQALAYDAERYPHFIDLPKAD